MYVLETFSLHHGLGRLSFAPALSPFYIVLSATKLVPQTASVDRIDSTKGYTPDNVQWVDKRINFMKQHFSQVEFVELCCLVSKHHYHKSNEFACQAN